MKQLKQPRIRIVVRKMTAPEEHRFEAAVEAFLAELVRLERAQGSENNEQPISKPK